MNTKERKATLSSSNKRLVIMGLFNTTGCDSNATKGVTFSGRAAVGQPKLAVADFFKHISPELRYVKDKSTRIGDTAFNTYKLQTPAQGGGIGFGQPITEDSPLLEQGVGQDERTRELVWQAAGGELFKSLINDLDEVVRFSDGRFSGALLKLARRYMIDYSDAQLADDKVDRAEWEKLAYDHSVSSAILSYVTCYRTDEPNATAEVAKALNGHAEGEDPVFNGDRVNQLLAGIEQFKRAAEAGAGDDAILQQISKDGQYRYLSDFPGSAAGLTVSGVGAKDFLSYYRYYLEKGSAVHRFLRNASLHSYLFMWLAGKYSRYESAEDFPVVAKEMYAHGIEGQGDKRIPGETKEEAKRNYELVRDAESTVADGDKAKLASSDIYGRMQSVLEQGILEKLRPEKAFRREALNKRNRELFVFLGQMAGGKAGQILGQATDKAGALSRIYRATKNVRAKEGEVLGVVDFEAALKRLRTGEMSKFVDSLLEEVQGLSGEGDALKDAACVAVVKRIAVETKTYFDETWLGSLDSIEEEVQALGDIYDLRNKVDVERREGSSRGMPMTVLTDKEISILAPVEATESDKKRYAESLTKAAGTSGAAQTGAASAALSVPSDLETDVASGSTGSIKDAAGKSLATLEADVERGVITATLSGGAEADDLLSEQAVVDFGELKDIKVVDVEGLDVEPLVSASRVKGQHLEGVASKFSSYSETQALLRDKYEADRRDKGDTPFTRAARALALGEFMTATPPEDSNLGVADLSNVLGVGLDMVEHVGEVSDAKMFAPGETLGPDVLGRINLSLHYPVNNPEELSRVLQYHHGQCQTLGDLGDYFSELQSIKALFQSMEGTDTEISVYNCKLADHADQRTVRRARDLFVVNRHPVAAYLSAQADVTESSLRSLAQRVAQTLSRRTDDTKTLQVPLVITNVDVSAEDVGLPVVGPSNLPLPQIVLAGTDAALEENVLPSTKAGVDSHLALAVSLAAGAVGSELGAVKDIDDLQSGNISDTLRVDAEDGHGLTRVFREAWFVIDSPLSAALCMTKWLNICLLDDPQDKDHLKDLLTSNCLSALKDASDPKQKDRYLAADAFAGLETSSLTDVEVYMPHVFEGKKATPIAKQTNARPLTAGLLGIRDKTGKRESNFGELPFLMAFSSAVAGGDSGDTDDE